MSPVKLILEDDGAPDYAHNVIEVLNSGLPPDGPKSPSEAADDLNALCLSEYAKTNHYARYLWRFWFLVSDLSRQIPYDSPEQARLQAVMKALHDLPPKEVDLGFSEQSSTAKLWKALPMFDGALYDVIHVDSRAPDDTRRKERRVNLVAFASRVAGLDIWPFFHMYATWDIAPALEGTLIPIEGGPAQINEDPAVVEDIEYHLRAAACWIVQAGYLLYDYDGECLGSKAGPLWKYHEKQTNKLRHLCPDRWQLWKERFAVVRDCEKLKQKTRQEAGEAYDVMVEIERNQNA